MQSFASLIFASAALAAAVNEHGPYYSSMGMQTSTYPALAASNSTGAYCGVGYTYCGYILKEQKSELHPALANEPGLTIIPHRLR